MFRARPAIRGSGKGAPHKKFEGEINGPGEKQLVPDRPAGGLPDGGGPARYLPGRVWAGGLAVFPRPLT